MSSTNFLDSNGLNYFWTKIKAYVAAHGGDGGTSSPEIFVGSSTPSGYTLYIDPEGSITDGNEVRY